MTKLGSFIVCNQEGNSWFQKKTNISFFETSIEARKETWGSDDVK